MASVTDQKVVIGSSTSGEPLKLVDQDTGEEVTFKGLKEQYWKLARETSLGGGHIAIGAGVIRTTPYVVLLVFEKLEYL